MNMLAFLFTERGNGLLESNSKADKDMKGTTHFTRTIEAYLNERAASDPLFAPALLKPNKNIEECVAYIINEVKASGCNGFADEEIYSMAVHYYDEDNLEVKKPDSCQVIVNHVVELTEEEKADARQKAIERYQQDEINKIKEQRKAKQKKVESTAKGEQFLFDF